MIPGVRGRLISASFVRDGLSSLTGGAAPPSAFGRALEAWAERHEATLGPASSVRLITDVAVVPLLSLLNLTVTSRQDLPGECLIQTACGTHPGPTILVVGWGEPLSSRWRTLVLESIAADVRWCFCCNGSALRIIDARHTWSREYIEFDCTLLGRESEASTLLWTLARHDALATRPPLLDRAVDLSARHGVEVCRALGAGVLDALQLLLEALRSQRVRTYPAPVLFEHSLTVLYRVLFLLFAEARGLVPMWHPVYRDRYSLDSIVTTLLAGRPYRGLWQAIHAISRLAHAGCSVGELTVNAFNGRLFSPAHASAFERKPVDDRVMGRAVMAVSTTAIARSATRRRIAYRDLDVEQLGAVYERVLDYEPALSETAASLMRGGDARKSSGTFYTPQPMTAFLVRRTLEPLVQNRRADEILRLRVLDPAMGSGAFLVAACRYLAAAAEHALIEEGHWHPGDITAADRAGLRRDIASRCLFGVDLNPMAVQLARLSLWLATLAADKPLSFLDHHLVVGNSLIGSSPEDVSRQPSRTGPVGKRQQALPLFDSGALRKELVDAARIRVTLASQPDDSPDVVRDKERVILALHSRSAHLGRWSRVLDLWCAGWFWPDGVPPDRATFGQLSQHVLTDRSALPAHVATLLLARGDAIAAHHRFFHWPLAFPEVLTVDPNHPTDTGFDAVVGNPPWDMVRGDSGVDDVRSTRRRDARALTGFVRESGIYRVDSRAHVNRYQLFVERALYLVRTGGRIGLVLPAGIVSDAGTAPLRRHLFDRADVDVLTGLDNRNAIFPVHRSVRFVLLTCTTGRPTSTIACRFGMTNIADLDRADSAGHAPLLLTRRFLARASGDDDLAVPELGSALDVRILERITAHVPWLGDSRGWSVHFGRELNATDDRHLFVPVTGTRDPAFDDTQAALSGNRRAGLGTRHSLGRPVVEGKLVDPFHVALDRCTLELPPDAASRTRVPRRSRLAYRDVASATNRLTLIAAIIPARAVTTHTLSCLKTTLTSTAQDVLCALLNSFVANYLIRLRVNTHVTVALVSRLPVPVVPEGHPQREPLASLTRALMALPYPIEDTAEYADLQARVAHLYGLTEEEFAHVLSTFPLISDDVKRRTRDRFNNFQ